MVTACYTRSCQWNDEGEGLLTTVTNLLSPRKPDTGTLDIGDGRTTTVQPLDTTTNLESPRSSRPVPRLRKEGAPEKAKSPTALLKEAVVTMTAALEQQKREIEECHQTTMQIKKKFDDLVHSQAEEKKGLQEWLTGYVDKRVRGMEASMNSLVKESIEEVVPKLDVFHKIEGRLNDLQHCSDMHTTVSKQQETLIWLQNKLRSLEHDVAVVKEEAHLERDRLDTVTVDVRTLHQYLQHGYPIHSKVRPEVDQELRKRAEEELSSLGSARHSWHSGGSALPRIPSPTGIAGRAKDGAKAGIEVLQGVLDRKFKSPRGSQTQGPAS